MGLQFTTTDLADITDRITEYRNNGLMGISSDTPMLGQLLACRESNQVASKQYVPAFTITPALANTYFNFDSDILYLRSDLACMENGFSCIPRSLRLLANTEELWKVKYLAIQVDEDLGGYDHLEIILAECLQHFGGVVKLTLVMVDHETDTKDASKLCLVDLAMGSGQSTGPKKIRIEADENRPALFYSYEKVFGSFIELCRTVDKDTRMGPTPWKVPDVIEHKAVVSEEVKAKIKKSKVVLRPKHLYRRKT